MKLHTMFTLAAMAVMPVAANTEGWETDYDTAVKKAAEGNKHLLMNFTGSDW